MLFKKDLILNPKISREKQLFIVHVLKVILKLLNILLIKELILNQKMTMKKLLFIAHVKVVKFQLLNIFSQKALINMCEIQTIIVHMMYLLIQSKKFSIIKLHNHSQSINPEYSFRITIFSYIQFPEIIILG